MNKIPKNAPFWKKYFLFSDFGRLAQANWNAIFCTNYLIISLLEKEKAFQFQLFQLIFQHIHPTLFYIYFYIYYIYK